MSSHSNPFPHLQCISTKFPFTLTPCQITAAAYDGQKHIFPYRAWKWYSVGFSLHVQHSLEGNVPLSRNVSRHKRSTDFIILLSSTHLLESSWICVSFIKHKIRKTVCPILCRFRKKVPFDLFGWTACWSKSFKADLSSWICMKALLQNRTSQQARRNWITLPPDSTKLKSGSDFWRHFGVSCHTRSGSPARRLFNRNFVGLFDGRGQSHYTVYALIVLCLVSTVWLWAGPVRGSGFCQIPGTRDCGT